ncbi:MAG TPA: hypothetical protein VJ773_06640, partial [Gemmatimonadales bacterium]|nr:hypothetical protein [Gemmatimonadales bacterium]
PAEAQEPAPLVAPLAVTPLAGQKVPVMPLTHLLVPSALAGDSAVSPRTRGLAWADSAFGELLVARLPEVTWVLPAELRRVARRAPGMVSEPDRMGQAALRNPGLTTVPDPLRSNLRTLAALTDARYILVPASATFDGEPGTVRAHLVVVMADIRTGAIVWRAAPQGEGASAALAYEAAVLQLVPPEAAP